MSKKKTEFQETPIVEEQHEIDKLRREYVEKQIMPWLIAHLQMRSTGLQVFVAVQGGLMYSFSTTSNKAILFLGLATCISFLFWDSRNRDIFTRLHTFAEKYVDRKIFGVDKEGNAIDGLHSQAIGTLKKSGKHGMRTNFRSHTWAIRIIIYTSIIAWFFQSDAPQYLSILTEKILSTIR